MVRVTARPLWPCAGPASPSGAGGGRRHRHATRTGGDHVFAHPRRRLVCAGSRELPGGELIASYLSAWKQRSAAAAQALASLQEVVIEYATGRCPVAANRDHWDQTRVAGMRAASIRTYLPMRRSWSAGSATHRANWSASWSITGCHPTTLAWENTLLSPDYVGSLREEVERAHRCPPVRLPARSLRRSSVHVMASSAILPWPTGMDGRSASRRSPPSPVWVPPGMDYRYAGRSISGATLGVWSYQPLSRGTAPQFPSILGRYLHRRSAVEGTSRCMRPAQRHRPTGSGGSSL